MQLPGVHSLWIHRLAARDRRTGEHRTGAVSNGPISKGDVSILRAATGPAEGAILGRGRISAAI